MKTAGQAVTLLLLLVATLVGWLALRQWLDLRRQEAWAAEQEDRRPLEVQRLAPMDRVLIETSGLAVSRQHAGVLWSHNDSGDEPRFFALDTTGHVRATVQLEGASATDWETMDLGPCPGPAETTCLYFGDTGDNGVRRSSLTLWIVPEPEPVSARVAPVGRIRYRYPDGPHDVEALAVHPTGDLVVVTKGRTPTILLYRLAAAEVDAASRADTTIVLPPGIPLSITPDFTIGRAVTGAAFDPSGSRLAVRTYTEVFFFAWPPSGESELEEVASCFVGFTEPQGEAVAFEDSTTLLLTSESRGDRDGSLTRVRCRLPGD